jgi:hypothetical protein
MAQYSSADLIFSIKDHGGVLRTLTGYVRAIGSISIEAIVQDNLTFGNTWAQYVSTRIKRMASLTIGGYYDDTATVGPDIIFGGYEGELREDTQFVMGGARSVTVDTIIQKYERLPKLGAMTEYQVTLQPTGPAVEA